MIVENNQLCGFYVWQYVFSSFNNNDITSHIASMMKALYDFFDTLL